MNTALLEIFYLLIGGVATYRLSRLISTEDGPGFVLRKLRQVPPEGSFAEKLISCEWCMSIWMAVLVALYLYCLVVYSPASNGRSAGGPCGPSQSFATSRGANRTLGTNRAFEGLVY